MKKTLMLGIITVLSTVILCQESYSQETKKEQRKEARIAAEEASEAQINELLATKDFMYQAMELQQTSNPNVQNIQLNRIWGIWITPNTFKAYLPVYGTSLNTFQPSLLKRMDFTSNSYKYEIHPGEAGGKNVTIMVNDMWTNTEYTFLIMVTANGQNSSMTVSSSFKAPITFMGSIETSSISAD